jgi:hypothetical protein
LSSYADSLLSNGERITLRLRQHWLAVVLDSRWGIAAIVAALVLLLIGGNLDPTGGVGTIRGLLGWVTLGLFLFGLVQIAFVLANWFNEEYIITNRRVMKVDGLLNKHSADSSLEKINDAVLDQNLLGRVLNYGDLDIVTAAEETVDRYRMLNRVIQFKKEMLNQKHDLEFEQMRPPVSPPLRTAPPAPPPPAAVVPPPMPTAPMTMSGDSLPSEGGSSRGAPAPRTMTPAEVTQTLSGLADLRDRGAITPEEYEAKKSDLLGRL